MAVIGARRPLQLRQKLYGRVLELRRLGLSYSEIQKRILEEAGECLSKSLISEWVRKVHTPYHDGLGEGGENQRRYKLRPCQELEFGRCASIAVGRQKPYKPLWSKKNQRWVVRAYSKELCNLLKKPIDFKKIKPYVEYSKECMAAFLRGLADAEGSANRNEASLGHIEISNTCLEVVKYAQRLLRSLGICSRIYERREEKSFIIEGRKCRRRKGTTWRLKIHRRNEILKFRELIGFAIKRKQKILEMIK